VVGHENHPQGGGYSATLWEEGKDLFRRRKILKTRGDGQFGAVESEMIRRGGALGLEGRNISEKKWECGEGGGGGGKRLGLTANCEETTTGVTTKGAQGCVNYEPKGGRAHIIAFQSRGRAKWGTVDAGNGSCRPPVRRKNHMGKDYFGLGVGAPKQTG